MNEETNRSEQNPEQGKATELSQKDLEQVSAGAPGDPLQGIDVSVGKKPKSTK
jgi:hypothetical protein